MGILATDTYAPSSGGRILGGRVISEHLGFLQLVLLGCIALVAFGTRLFSVLRYESVIHEFDPWFNFRATKYLVENGWYAFLNWFDERAWYPLGRVVGVTVYPGIMITSAILHHLANSILALKIEIRDICVFLAPVFAGLTAVATFGVTKELEGGGGAGLLAAAFIAICPGYISRSVAGSYDNEGIAIFLMMATFFCWLKAIKSGSAIWGAATALTYFYMVSSWGGYVFIINLIPLHVFTLLVMGRYSPRLYTSYCTFYVLGTLASMTIPFVGFQPIKSSEHMAAMGVFCLMQLMALVDQVKGLVDDAKHFRRLTTALIVSIFLLLLTVLIVLTMTDHISPWTGRFYSLWDTSYARKHIPIIASVSEHQPTTWGSFFLDMHMLLFLAPAGLYLCFQEGRDEHIFAVVYVITAAYFAGVMVRLLLTLAPIMCVLGAIAAGRLVEIYTPGPSNKSPINDNDSNNSNNDDNNHTGGNRAILHRSASKLSEFSKEKGGTRDNEDRASWSIFDIIIVIAPLTLLFGYFILHCTWMTRSAYSSPSIILSSTDPRTGQTRIIDDFREAYYWLRRNSAPEAKILAWWDYGYQLAGMADRTTIVDNNTWNNTHIATVGKALALPEETAYPVLRELGTDYILILSGALSGFGGDDINKFLWMIRIAEGIFPESVKEADYLTEAGEYRLDAGAPPALRNSLLYKMTYYGVASAVGPAAVDRARQVSIAGVDPKLSTLDEAYTTDNHIVRIFKVRSPDTLGRSLFRK